MSKKVVKLSPDPANGRCTNLADVRIRFHESIVLFNGHPFYAKKTETDNGEWNQLRLYEYNVERNTFSRNHVSVLYNDSRISTNFELGYVNLDFSKKLMANYISRIPVRRYKQGLDRHNTTSTDMLNQSHVADYKDIARALLGNNSQFKYLLYPTLDEYIKDSLNVKRDDSNYYQINFSSALSRNVAISKKIDSLHNKNNDPYNIYIDGNYVADFNPNNGLILKKDGLYSVYHEYFNEVGL